MSIFMMVALGVTLNGEPRAAAHFFPTRVACENFRKAWDAEPDNEPMRATSSDCKELKLPEAA